MEAMTETPTTDKQELSEQNAQAATTEAFAKGELFEMPDTPLGRVATVFVDVLRDIANLKLKKKEAGEAVLEAMRKEGRERLTITVNTDNYLFEIKHGADELICQKQTRSPVPKSEKAPPDGDLTAAAE